MTIKPRQCRGFFVAPALPVTAASAPRLPQASTKVVDQRARIDTVAATPKHIGQIEIYRGDSGCVFKMLPAALRWHWRW
jgi:hypothetical protein